MSDLPTQRTMEGAAAQLVGRELRPDERQMLLNLRDQYGYDDSDPLVVVLAMMGAYTIVAKEIPDKIREASKSIIETHALVLREQSMVVAKDLVGSIASTIHSEGRKRKDRWLDGLIGGIIGALLVAFVGAVWMYVLRR